VKHEPSSIHSFALSVSRSSSAAASATTISTLWTLLDHLEAFNEYLTKLKVRRIPDRVCDAIANVRELDQAHRENRLKDLISSNDPASDRRVQELVWSVVEAQQLVTIFKGIRGYEPLKSICQSSLGASRSKRCNGRCPGAAAGLSNPARRGMPVTALGAKAGPPWCASKRASLRPPHELRDWSEPHGLDSRQAGDRTWVWACSSSNRTGER
jgi:hypothetical protein